MIGHTKLSITLLFLYATINLFANMASPDHYGFHPSLGIHSCDVHIEREFLGITLVDSASYAIYEVEYDIKNEKEQDRFTLVFDCVLEFADFEVSLDGIPVEIYKNDVDSLLLANLEDGYTPFTITLDKGRHTIKVKYKGYPDSNVMGLVTKYTFKYNLEPASGWKSFKNFNLMIDARALKEDVSITILDKTYQLDGDTVYSWYFEDIPQKMLEIKFKPKGDLTYNLDPAWFFIAAFLIFAAINIVWLVLWRRKHVWTKYTLPSIIGALVVPAIALYSYFFGLDFIDDLIGQYATRRHGYIFLIVFSYTFLAAIYFVILWCIDHKYKKKRKR